jgi:hypothetical protein
MREEEALAKIKAAGWGAAAEIGWHEAIAMLKQVAREIEDAQWQGPGNR